MKAIEYIQVISELVNLVCGVVILMILITFAKNFGTLLKLAGEVGM